MIEDRIIVWEMNNRPVQDIASQLYNVDAITLARVKQARLFRETLGADLDQAEARISARLDAALRQTYGRRSFDAALSSERAVMMREIREELRKEADTLGIEIVDVRVRRTDLSENVLTQTYTRMESERNALAARIVSEGQATKTQRNAETDRMVTEQVSTARRDAEIIKGKADADRNRIFAEAFQQDPEFFAFYRSMQAYVKSLGNEGTTLVLDPKSDFFKHFGTQKDGTQVPTTPQ
jgi:modulator of FtsH protease HflC